MKFTHQIRPCIDNGKETQSFQSIPEFREAEKGMEAGSRIFWTVYAYNSNGTQTAVKDFDNQPMAIIWAKKQGFAETCLLPHN